MPERHSVNNFGLFVGLLVRDDWESIQLKVMKNQDNIPEVISWNLEYIVHPKYFPNESRVI